MKNVKRIILLIALIVFVAKVLSSDFDVVNSEEHNTAVASK